MINIVQISYIATKFLLHMKNQVFATIIKFPLHMQIQVFLP